MANCNSAFLNYHTKISLPGSQEKNLIAKHNTLRGVIEAYFKSQKAYKVPQFFIQGSHKMKTMTLKRDNTYDVDLGVYFSEKPIHNCTTVQNHVLAAVKTHTSGGARHLQKCIRVIYASDFNIDLPVYYQTPGDKMARIAIKNGDWRVDDPEEFVNWFNHQRKKEIKSDGQLIRIVKYLKRWANERSFKTPSGAALSVWAGKHFQPKAERDDIAFYQTIKAIRGSFFWSVSCQCPVQPNDDLVANLDSNQKTKFKRALTLLCEDAENAINASTSLESAIKLWGQHLGNKFTL